MDTEQNTAVAKRTRLLQGEFWFAYPKAGGDMLRDKRGVGRRFKSEAAALKAAKAWTTEKQS